LSSDSPSGCAQAIKTTNSRNRASGERITVGLDVSSPL
jgi:hypothetical protein